MRLRDLEMIEHRDAIAHHVLVAVSIGRCRNVGRGIAARRIGDGAVALAEFAQLRLPAAVVGCKLMHEQNGRTLPHFFVIELHVVGCDGVRHETSGRSGGGTLYADRHRPEATTNCQTQNGRRLAGRDIDAVCRAQPGWRAAQPKSMRRRQAVCRRPISRCAVVLASARLAAAQVRYSKSATRDTSGWWPNSRAKGPALPLSFSPEIACATFPAWPNAITRPDMV